MCDRLAEHCAREFERHVDELLSIHKRGRILVASPFFRERSVPVDDIPKLKLLVRNALRARAWFARHGPAWSPLLPLSAAERIAMFLSDDGALHLIVLYSLSLHARDYDFLRHPLFFDYARGLMADPHAPLRRRRTQGQGFRFRSLVPGLPRRSDGCILAR